MADYQLTQGPVVLHVPSGMFISPGKTVHWRQYLDWKSAGNTPDPAPDPPAPIDHLIEMRDLLLQARSDFDAATSLLEAKAALLDLVDALLGRRPGQTTTMQVRVKR